jgi:hypothetical protein
MKTGAANSGVGAAGGGIGDYARRAQVRTADDTHTTFDDDAERTERCNRPLFALLQQDSPHTNTPRKRLPPFSSHSLSAFSHPSYS